ncbi:hypothetical protein BGW80DRAFT_1282338 [Lactifluus volemus]|nr:hypothetical protein BGW80DRAFT_1282338 [Lactifluus volemus]
MRTALVLLSFFRLACSAQIYFHPRVSATGTLPHSVASVLIAQHLHLDRSLLISVDDADAKCRRYPREDLPSPVTLSNITETSLQRATHAFSHVYDVSSGAKDTFVRLLDIMNVSPQRRPSEQYRTATASLTAALRSALTKPYLNLVILTYPQVGADGGMAKRQDQSPEPPRVPLPPVGSDTLCFTSEEVCTNSTDSCSGHGACAPANKAGRLCYACSCEARKDSKGRTEYWAGGKCERKDVSGPFVLIAGTVITLILIVLGSVTVLYSIASQPLPSVLTSSVPNMSVKE